MFFVFRVVEHVFRSWPFEINCFHVYTCGIIDFDSRKDDSGAARLLWVSGGQSGYEFAAWVP